MSIPLKLASRRDLYSDEELSDNEPVLLPKLEFEIVENSEQADTIEDPPIEEDEEFDFPLFSFGGAADDEDVSPTTVEDPERGRTMEKSTVMKVTLRSPSPEEFNRKRPDTHYFAVYDERAKYEFQVSAITAEEVCRTSLHTTSYSIGKVLDLTAHNDKIEFQIKREKRRMRPGKKARQSRVVGKTRNEDRRKVQKEIDDEAFRKLMKKKNHKRGGKKNKKKKTASSTASTPAKQPKQKPSVKK